jgi:hypothetical protein
MRKLLIVLLYILSSITSYCQAKKAVECWKVTDEKTNLYFNNLFANITGSDPNLTEIRLDFIESKMIYILGIQGVREYCKQKYNLPDSSVKNFTNQFIRSGKKIPLADTSLLRKQESPLNKYSLIADSLLNKYRTLGVRDFILRNCEGGILKLDLDISLLAYLFENRIFWENMSGKLSPFALKQIESSCKIKWDYRKKKWVDLEINRKRAK